MRGWIRGDPCLQTRLRVARAAIPRIRQQVLRLAQLGFLSRQLRQGGFEFPLVMRLLRYMMADDQTAAISTLAWAW